MHSEYIALDMHISHNIPDMFTKWHIFFPHCHPVITLF
jgi:hypothetical protein